MAPTGGSVDAVAVAGREFSVAADADGTRDFGGKTAEWEPNGNGTARAILTAKNWKFEGLTLSVDDDNGDQEFLQETMDAGVAVPIVFTMASGLSYSASGLPTGDLGASSQSATAALNFSGPGKLAIQ